MNIRILTNPGIYVRDLIQSINSGFSPQYENVGLKSNDGASLITGINAGVSEVFIQIVKPESKEYYHR
jgi:hypothetical protein